MTTRTGREPELSGARPDSPPTTLWVVEGTLSLTGVGGVLGIYDAEAPARHYAGDLLSSGYAHHLHVYTMVLNKQFIMQSAIDEKRAGPRLDSPWREPIETRPPLAGDIYGLLGNALGEIVRFDEGNVGLKNVRAEIDLSFRTEEGIAVCEKAGLPLIANLPIFLEKIGHRCYRILAIRAVGGVPGRNNVQVVAAPDDYIHPDLAELAAFQIGDRVRTPSGEECSVIDIRESYENRANERIDLPMYQVNSRLPGSPIVWFFGWQLTRIEEPSDD
jgi:hypothetical protein